MLIIDDDNYKDFLTPSLADGTKLCRGLVPRDMQQQPVGYLGELCPPMHSVNMPLIPRSDWSAMIKEQEQTKSRLSDIRRNARGPGRHFEALDQNGQGYCWAYAATGCVMMLRAASNMPYVRLSAHAIACKIKNFRDEGGWGALGLEYIIKHGVPSIEAWPEKSMSRANDRPETWVDAAKYKVTESWMDLDAAIYDRDLTFDQMATCLLNRRPVAIDLNWWGHAVFAMDLVEVERNSFGVRILNSWSDRWGDLGEGVLRGNKAIPDNAVAPRVVTAG